MHRSSRQLPALALALVCIAPLASAANLDVPVPFPTIQLAIDAASAGDTIFVHGGTYGPITIDKPLTIIGTVPGTLIDNTTSFPAPFIPPAIALDGPGTGRVVLSGIDTRGIADGTLYSATASGISGDGFDELHVHACSIQAAEWDQITGLAWGEAAIDVSVPYVLITRSNVTGGRTLIDACDFATGLPPSGAGVYAPSSTVVSLASRIEGGEGGDLCFTAPFCPTLGPGLGAQGGAGVIADCLFAQDNLTTMYVRGGAGGEVSCGAALLGTQPAGIDKLANQLKPQPQFLTYDVNAEVHPGGTLNVTLAPSWVWGGTPQFMLVGAPTPPVYLPLHGHLFMDAATMSVTSISLPGGPVSIPIGPDPSIIGLDVALQYWSPQTRLTDPYITVVEP